MVGPAAPRMQVKNGVSQVQVTDERVPLADRQQPRPATRPAVVDRSAVFARPVDGHQTGVHRLV